METFIVWTIVGVVAVLTLRAFYRSLSGKGGSCGCACDRCPAGEEECGKDEDARP
jgi:attachment p12 family protein